ncbi:hypothetical protein MKX03_004536 [Papaver bracteatum]|nr:hypothetical protein MKX03_004536 [Papaver bracteatum]
MISLQINQELLDIYKRKDDQASKSSARLPQVSDDAFSADTTCETLMLRLEQIWDEDGETDDKRNMMSRQIDQECMDVYKRKVDQAAKSRALRRGKLADAKTELSMLASALGQKNVHEKWTGTIKKQLAAIGIKLEHLRVLKDKRKEDFADVQSQIQNVYMEIAGNPRFTGPEEAPKFSEDDVSLKKLVEFRSQLQRLQETSNRFRFLEVADLVDTVYDLCSVLGIDFINFINEVHQPSLIDSDLWVQSESIDNETFSKLAKTIVDLKKDKMERLEKLQELARHLVVLWNLMDISPEERSWFDDHVTHISAATVDEVTLCEALSFDRINDVKREIERLALKAIAI